ncbi:hypothetical protein [Bacillus sp. Marseille-P3661]|uniref:hypothetical protein n=1 Tax=Bacillus sp. Marseille-P3661 TaxID=1936234 RepID=UPI000C8375D4|nr:hypothetical protein [Bacillus sp. Marseille-P3661]
MFTEVLVIKGKAFKEWYINRKDNRKIMVADADSEISLEVLKDTEYYIIAQQSTTSIDLYRVRYANKETKITDWLRENNQLIE